MSKISIVGVQGSGKTVLMAALGAKYKQPDEYGLFLSPESPEAFGFVRNEMAKMRTGEKHGDWPGTTTPDSMCMLRWSLRRKTEGGDTKLCDLEFLDFGGEIYKRAFGSGTLQESKDAAEDWAEEIAALKKHIEESDVLLVLVNLRDVISGVVNKETNARLYATKGVLDYATRELKIKQIALAFTQVDAYRKVIDESDRLSDVLQTHFSDVANVYSSPPLFAVSAVDKTFTGDDGRAYPAKDFGSQGLDDVVHWIVDGSGAWPEDPFNEEKRHLQSLWDGICARCDKLEKDYTASEGMNSADRQRLVAETVPLIGELANHPKRNKAIGFSQEKLDGYRQHVTKWSEFEGRVGTLLDAERAEKKELAEELWQELSVAELPEGFSLSRVQAEAERIRIEIAARRRNIIIGLIIAGVVVIAGLVAVLVNNAKVDKLCADGYSCESTFGIKKAVWKRGKTHCTVTYLKTTEKEGEWESTRPGHKWVSGTLMDEWQKNLPYPGRDDLISKKKEGCWHCTRDGWECEAQGGTNLVWQKGVRHSKCKWLIASSNKEGEWESTRPGYVWDHKEGIEWQEGEVYPHLNLRSLSKGKFESTKDGYMWDAEAYRERGEYKINWTPGQPSKEHPHCVAGPKEKPGSWLPADGYKWKSPDKDDDYSTEWDPKWVSTNGNRRATAVDGVFEKRVLCGCGNGYVYVVCKKCAGKGEELCESTCFACDTRGRSNKDCPFCEGEGKRKVQCVNNWSRYENWSIGGQVQTFHVQNCGNCWQASGFFSSLDILPYGFQSPSNACRHCNPYAQGVHPGRLNCPTCNGRGWREEPCTWCEGTGKKKCAECGGTQKIHKKCQCTNDQRGKQKEKCEECDGKMYRWVQEQSEGEIKR